MWSPCHLASSKQTYVHMWEKLAAFPARCRPVKLCNPSNWSSRTLISLILVYLVTWGQLLLGQWDLGSKQRLKSVFYLYFNIYILKQYGYLWQSCPWLLGHWIVSVNPQKTHQMWNSLGQKLQYFGTSPKSPIWEFDVTGPRWALKCNFSSCLGIEEKWQIKENRIKVVDFTYFGGLFSGRLDQSQIQSAFFFIRFSTSHLRSWKSSSD